MKINMIRTDFLESGIFGALETEDESLFLLTLEHAYPIPESGASTDRSWAPKIPKGTYTCIRGMHRLAGATEDFETFEITGVDGHTGLLFHPGNFNHDSSGCVLLGLARNGDEGIMNSRDAFKMFMEKQKECDSFALTIS